MFRIRRVFDNTLHINQSEIAQVQEILRQQFPLISSEEVESLPDKLADPLRFRFRTILFVMDDVKGRVKGFALLQHASDLGFCYLDFISAAPGGTGAGVGSLLYERVRQEALAMDAIGIFMECLPDDAALCSDPTVLRQNSSRLRFYERYGARPIANTAYEAPVRPEDDCPPYLVFDGLGREQPLSRKKAKQIVRAILDRKYKELCPEEYVAMVLDSFRDDPVHLRPFRYIKKQPAVSVPQSVPDDKKVLLLVNDGHSIHHVRERGYVESPVRIASILKEIEASGLFLRSPVRAFPERHIREVHDPGYVDYFKRVCSDLPPGKSIYPYVFPIRNSARPPKVLAVRAGYYCIDTFTPLNQNAYLAAKGAVDCALTGAQRIREGNRLAYALVRPPGHHAERKAFGGFCYFNSAAIAAHFLSEHGRVAILDIDYHHGNGQQDIFYSRSDVFTLSIHGHPSFAYPYFSGFAEEAGEGEGEGYNVNFALPEEVDGDRYLKILAQAVDKIRRYDPRFLIVALGLDPAKGDPTGSWTLMAKHFEAAGRMIGGIHRPTLVVQEGGYRIRDVGKNARHFFRGLWSAVWV